MSDPQSIPDSKDDNPFAFEFDDEYYDDEYEYDDDEDWFDDYDEDWFDDYSDEIDRHGLRMAGDDDE